MRLETLQEVGPYSENRSARSFGRAWHSVSASDKMQKNAGQKMQVCSGEECNMVHSNLPAVVEAERVSKRKEQTGWISEATGKEDSATQRSRASTTLTQLSAAKPSKLDPYKEQIAIWLEEAPYSAE